MISTIVKFSAFDKFIDELSNYLTDNSYEVEQTSFPNEKGLHELTDVEVVINDSNYIDDNFSTLVENFSNQYDTAFASNMLNIQVEKVSEHRAKLHFKDMNSKTLCILSYKY